MVEARHAAGLTQEQVAARMGTTQSVVARLENAHHLPSLEHGLPRWERRGRASRGGGERGDGANGSSGLARAIARDTRTAKRHRKSLPPLAAVHRQPRRWPRSQGRRRRHARAAPSGKTPTRRGRPGGGRRRRGARAGGRPCARRRRAVRALGGEETARPPRRAARPASLQPGATCPGRAPMSSRSPGSSQASRRSAGGMAAWRATSRPSGHILCRRRGRALDAGWRFRG